MLFLLVHWGQASHTRAQKEQAFNIFSDILQLTFAGASSDILWEDAEWDAPLGDMEEPVYDDRPAASGVVCEHLHRAQERFQEWRRAGTFLDLVRFAFEASQTSAACRRMHFWVVELLCSLAESMERRLVGQCVGQHTPEGLRQLDRKSKRRRLDPELRRMAEVAVAEGRFRSQPAMARAGFAGVCRRTAGDFDMKMLCEYLGATAKLFDNTRQLCIACDASRLGGRTPCSLQHGCGATRRQRGFRCRLFWGRGGLPMGWGSGDVFPGAHRATCIVKVILASRAAP